MKIKTLTVGPAAANCYVAYEGGEAAVVDPGFDADMIESFLKKNRLSARYILLTHGHFDHILAAPELRRRTGAKIVVSRADAELLASPIRSLAARVRLEQEPFEADFLAEEGSAYVAGGMEFRYLLTPGHTPGSAVITAGEAIFCGDTLFCDGCGRTDLPGGSPEDMRESLRRLCSLAGDYKLYPGHDRPTTLAREREANLYMREAVFGEQEE